MTLVDRKQVMEHLTKEYNRRLALGDRDGLKLAWIEKAVNDAPTVDAVPVKPVEWHIWHIFNEEGEGWYAECPNCGKRYPAIDVTNWNYCPTCGAKMVGGEW